VGAWGFGPLDSDQALDWMAEVIDPAGQKVEELLAFFDRAYDKDGEESAVYEFALQLRAAAYVVETLNFFNERIHPNLHERVAEALVKIMDCRAWMESWTELSTVSEEITRQITALREGPKPTTLSDNL
jgi:hypothetical protein